MIKELAISAALVAVLASLPYLFSPLQVAIGSFTDRHPLWVTGARLRSCWVCCCVWRVSPSLPSGFPDGQQRLGGLALAALAFGAWGMGYNFATVSYSRWLPSYRRAGQKPHGGGDVVYDDRQHYPDRGGFEPDAGYLLPSGAGNGFSGGGWSCSGFGTGRAGAFGAPPPEVSAAAPNGPGWR